MLPYFFNHYGSLVDRFFVYDNGSTDGSLDLLRGDERVVVRHFQTPADSFVAEERRLSNVMWIPSRGSADWVIMVDIDEHVFHRDLPGYLAQCRARQITVIKAEGYEMVGSGFPPTTDRLVDVITEGVRDANGLDKTVVFDPNALFATGYGPGRHTAEPRGRVVFAPYNEVKMLHYRFIDMSYVINRFSELRGGLKRDDFANGWGEQYTWTRARVAREFQRLFEAAEHVRGLGPEATGQSLNAPSGRTCDRPPGGELGRPAES